MTADPIAVVEALVAAFNRRDGAAIAGLILSPTLVFGLLLVWYLFSRSSAPRERSYKPDVLDEGAAPAARNQALRVLRLRRGQACRA